MPNYLTTIRKNQKKQVRRKRIQKTALGVMVVSIIGAIVAKATHPPEQ